MFNSMEFGTYYETIGYELRDALSRYYDAWLEVLSKDENERPLHLSTVEKRRITVILHTCSLLEHNINFYLCTKCDAPAFAEMERKSLKRKWTEFVKQFVLSYEVPPDVLKDLETLVDRRNVMVHAKPMLSIDGDNRHAGNEPSVALDENTFMERCACLPFLLLENLLHYDRGSFIAMSSIRDSCGSVGRELNAARYRFDYIARVPEALLQEIMGQGHSLDRAKLFAALIGEVPRRRSDGSIAVRRNGGIIAILKALKFFEGGSFVLDPSRL